VQAGVARDAGIVGQHVDRTELALDHADGITAFLMVADIPAIGRDAGRF